jgi:O-antigen ligase/polysaccharide polymerase Wzy-like membrane protein
MTWLRAAIVTALLAGPTVLAFFSGGYFDRPRLWAGVAAWIAVGVAAVACPRPWPRTRAAWLAVGGLAALTAWTAASITWAPLRDAAQDDAQRLLLYLGVLIAGIAVFRSRTAARAAEPALALGTLVVVAEGLSERLLPGLFTLARSDTVPGRLFQPLTYWNAMGLLAAIGVVLCVRLAGDRTRSRWMRICAAAVTPTLAVGCYLALSRGAIAALAVGLALLALLRPTVVQLRALGRLAAACGPPVVVAALLSGVRTLEGSASARHAEGLGMLAALVIAGLVAAAVVGREALRAQPGGLPEIAAPGARLPTAVVAIVVAGGIALGFAVLVGQEHESIISPSESAANSRLASADSIRGDFWRVARDAFADEPVRGVGSGGFAVVWLRERPVDNAARDAHSWYFETLGELGLVGLALLAAFLGGIVACAFRAQALDPSLAAGPIAVGAAWLVHAGLDWDWEMPGVTLPALVLAAVLVAHGEKSRRRPAEVPRREERVPDQRPVVVEVGP